MCGIGPRVTIHAPELPALPSEIKDGRRGGFSEIKFAGTHATGQFPVPRISLGEMPLRATEALLLLIDSIV